MKTASSNISAVQLNHLVSNPVQLVPPPPPNKVLMPVSLSFEYRFVSIPNGGNQHQIFVGYDTFSPTRSLFGNLQISQLTSYLRFLPFDNNEFLPPSLVASSGLHLTTGQDTINWGQIDSTQVHNGGAGYSIGDEGEIHSSSGYSNARYIVDTVGPTGNVLSFHISLNSFGYAVNIDGAGTSTSGSGDGNFLVDIISVFPGNGTARVSLLYDIIDLIW